MKPRRVSRSLWGAALLFLAATTAPIAGRAAAPAISAEEIVNNYIAARGGLDKIKAIRTLRLQGPPRPDGRPGRQMLRARPFYFTIGGEGNDGAPWEAWDDAGLRARVTHLAGAALRHTAYFDDPLIMSREPGWRIELTGSELVDGHDTYRLRVVFPDEWVNELYVDKRTWLLIGRQITAPFHAFGEEVTTRTLIGNYKEVGGVLFPTQFAEYDLATGELLGGVGEWATIEANVPLSPGTFAPPPAPETPVSALVNAIFAARFITSDALGWYHDFLADPARRGVDIKRPIEYVAYQCLKNGAVSTGLALLEENLAAHPDSASAEFGLGRALRAAGRETDALARFRRALVIDPAYQPARDAIASKRTKY